MSNELNSSSLTLEANNSQLNSNPSHSTQSSIESQSNSNPVHSTQSSIESQSNFISSHSTNSHSNGTQSLASECAHKSTTELSSFNISEQKTPNARKKRKDFHLDNPESLWPGDFCYPTSKLDTNLLKRLRNPKKKISDSQLQIVVKTLYNYIKFDLKQ